MEQNIIIIKYENAGHKVTEEIPVSGMQAKRVRAMLLNLGVASYNATSPCASIQEDKESRRVGPATPRQMELIRDWERVPAKKKAMERICRTEGISMDHLTNAQANRLIQGTKETTKTNE